MLVALVLADLSFRLRPTGYFGGSTDDQRYLEAALSWLTQGPHAGRTHWALRHPLVLSVVASFKMFGISMSALQLVPRFYADLLVAMTAGFVARAAGVRTAALWVALALCSPILHEMATSCFPEMLELTFGAASMWLFWEACGRETPPSGRRSAVLLIGSGVALALATLTRETAVCLLPLYGYAWLRGRIKLSGMIWFAVGFVPPIAFDVAWLWSLTGDPLYRLHVDQSHIGIHSDHLVGGVYHGRAFLNPDLASRWVPSGPVKLHWTINPLLDFFAAPQFGLIFAAWLLLWCARPTRPAPGTIARHAMPVLLAVTIASYLVVTWALTLRPQPRYYLFAVYAATLAVALICAQAPRGGTAARRLRAGAIGLVLLAGIITISLAPDRQRDARMILPWLKAHPGETLHVARKDAERLAFSSILAGVRQQVSANPAAIGGLRIRLPLSPDEVRDDGPPDEWQHIATLVGPRRFPYINAPRRLMIERRLY